MEYLIGTKRIRRPRTRSPWPAQGRARWESMEALGPKIRRQRRRLGLTLDELAARVSISKPYLSLIENGRVVNPPSDEKLRRLEQMLGFTPGELLTQAHLQRTPQDVRAVLQQLMAASGKEADEREQRAAAAASPPRHNMAQDVGVSAEPRPAPVAPNLDPAYLSGVLREMADRSGLTRVTAHAIPVINRVSADYPRDFCDLNYPPRVADEYVSCPDVTDRAAFAARVHGDSMMPQYRPDDIVIFSPALEARDGDDCFIRFADGQTTFKRIFFEPNDAGQPHLRLQPRNERYRPQTVPSQNVAGLYKAIYRYQRVGSASAEAVMGV